VLGAMTPSQFKEVVNREDVRFNIIRQEIYATCRHVSAVPGYSAIIYYAEGVNEVWKWRPFGEWHLESIGTY
jgi:hypothetical protein